MIITHERSLSASWSITINHCYFKEKLLPVFNFSCLSAVNHVFRLDSRIVKSVSIGIWIDVPAVLMVACVCICQERGMAPLKWQWRLWSLAPCPLSPSWKRLRSWRNSATTSWCSFTLWFLRSPFTSSQSTWAKVDEHKHMHMSTLLINRHSHRSL